MVSTVVYERAGGEASLVCGLAWNVLSVSRKADAQIRELARGDASHVVRVLSTQREEVRTGRKVLSVRKEAVGLYTSLDGAKPSRDAHSLAAAFAAWTREHPRALFSHKVDIDRWVVVVIVNGHPVLDKVVPTAEAAAAICQTYLDDGQQLSVFSDDVESYPGSLVSDGLLEHICGALSDQTRLKPIPRDVVLTMLLAIAACAVAGGGLFYVHKQQERKRLEALQRQRDADPVPKYLNALAVARESVGVERASIKAGVEYAQRIPLTPNGWRASRISCDQDKTCEVRYARSTGTFKGLQSAVSFLSLAPAIEVNLNEARLTWQQSVAASKLPVGIQLPQMTSFIQGPEASKLQDWLVAGLTIQIAPPRLWPQADGVPETFKHPQALAAGKFEIDSIALPQLLEAASNAPDNVIWTGWSIDISDAAGEPLNRAKGRLTGSFYVTNTR